MGVKPPVHKCKMDVDMIDLHDLFKLSDADYREFVRDNGLTFLDSHRVLRVASCDSGLATTREQLDILIEELQALRPEMSPRDEV